MPKKTTLANIIRTIPEQVYVSVLNKTMGTSFENFKEFIEVVSEETKQYFFEVLQVVDSSVFRNTEQIRSHYRRFDIMKTILSETETRDRCFVALQSLDKKIYEMYGQSEGTPNKWGFEFTTKEDWNKYLSSILVSPRRGETSLAKKTIFDKENFLRNMKNSLWDYFDREYSLSN